MSKVKLEDLPHMSLKELKHFELEQRLNDKKLHPHRSFSHVISTFKSKSEGSVQVERVVERIDKAIEGYDTDDCINAMVFVLHDLEARLTGDTTLAEFAELEVERLEEGTGWEHE